jgi:hypothetical protein
MGLRRTKMNENDATIFIPIRVSSYPCFFHPWLFSQEFPMSRVLTKRNENSELASLRLFHNS